jgi:hypothetical protein
VNRGLRLKGIGFIEQRGGATTERISLGQAIRRLVRVASLPLFDREAAPRVFDGLADMCGRVPTWLLSVPADPTAALAVHALAEGRALSVA